MVMQQPAARRRFARRKAIVERSFAELRMRQGLTRFHRRGESGARVEFALHCIAFNLKWAILRISVNGSIRVGLLVMAETGDGVCVLPFWIVAARDTGEISAICAVRLSTLRS